MKIVMIASTYPRYAMDGAARFNHSIAEALVEWGQEVHAVVPYSPLIKPFATSVKIHVFRYIWPPKLSIMGYAQAMHSDRKLKRATLLLAPFFFLMGTLKLWQIVRSYDVDVIHAHWVVPSGFIAAVVSKLTGKPLFISLHGSDVFFASRNSFLGKVASWTFKQGSGITACSPELIKGALALNAAAEKIHLLPWGADLKVFNQPNNDTIECLRSKFGLSPETRIVMGLGRLVGKKGFVNLIEALARLKSPIPDACLMIVGDGPEMAVLRARAEALGLADKVILVGNIDWTEVPDYLALSDIVVVPSIHDNGNVDGLPTVVLEAMAAGKPIVASNIGGIPLVVKDGINGFLVAEGDIPALVSCLSKLLMSEEMLTSYGRRSREFVENRLNWKNVALAFLQMYHHQKISLEVPFDFLEGRFNHSR